MLFVITMSKLWIGCVLFGFIVLPTSAQPQVFMMNSTVIGKTVMYESYTIKEFLGIPFARPPVGDLRFQKPVAQVYLNSDPYNATTYRPCCPQMMKMENMGNENEDCLYLNVFVPNTASDGPNGHAVMIWVHGGMFNVGGAEKYDPAHLASRGNVIVVTFNYRLGIFGFLSTKDGNAAGNYGLYDQHCVISWVNQHIATFGGDPSRVTVSGHDAGGVSAVIQGMYVKNYGMIHRIISQSGSFPTPLIKVDKDPLPVAELVANALFCPTYDRKAMIDCLKQYPWSTIREVIISYSQYPENAKMLNFHPVVDGDIISMSPKDMAEMMPTQVPECIQFFRSLNLLTGFNAFEGGNLANVSAEMEMNSTKMNNQSMNYNQMNNSQEMKNHAGMKHMEKVLHHMYDKKFPNATKLLVLHEYTNWSNPHSNKSMKAQFVKALGDAVFVVPTVLSAKMHSQDNDVQMTHVYHFVPVSTHRPLHTPNWLPGADHGEEVQFVFGHNYSAMASWEMNLSDKMVKYWTNFVKSGHPGGPVTVDMMWPGYSMPDQWYLEFDKNMGNHSMKQFLGAREAHFWKMVLPAHMKMKENSTMNNCRTNAGVEQPRPDVRFMTICLTVLSVAFLHF